MKCVICKHGELARGVATLTRQRAGTTVILKDVPVLVCDNCGEEYLDDQTTDVVQALTAEVAVAGAEVVVRTYSEAA